MRKPPGGPREPGETCARLTAALEKGEALLGCGRAGEAQALWQAELDGLPDGVKTGGGPEMILLLGRVQAKLPAARAAALRNLDAGLRRRPGDAQALLARGVLRLNQASDGAYPLLDSAMLALKDIERALRADPGLGLAYAWRAEAGYSVGRGWGQGGLKDLLKAAALCPRDAWVHGRLGMALFTAGRPEAARDSFDRALTFNPSLDWAYAYKGMILRAAGDAAGGAALLRRSLRIGRGGNPLPWLWLVQCCLDLRRWATAAGEAARLLARHPGEYVVVYRLLEIAFRSLGRYRRAEAALDRLGGLDPSLADWAFFHPDLPDYAGSSQAALRRLAEALPDYAPARCWLGRAYAAAGRQDLALKEYDKAVGLSPGYLWGRCLRAGARWRIGDAAGADADAAAVLAAAPDFLPALALRGELELRGGRPRAALRLLNRYIARRPIDPDPYRLRAQAWLQLGKKDAAKSDLRAALLREKVFSSSGSGGGPTAGLRKRRRPAA